MLDELLRRRWPELLLLLVGLLCLSLIVLGGSTGCCPPSPAWPMRPPAPPVLTDVSAEEWVADEATMRDMEKVALSLHLWMEYARKMELLGRWRTAAD